MPLFRCSKCGCADNTATALNFWPEYYLNQKAPLCSECDPEQGEWHGSFQKRSAAMAAKSDPPDASWIWWDERDKRHKRVPAAVVARLTHLTPTPEGGSHAKKA